MPGEYERLGMRFQYPENWTLQREQTPADCESVTVTSPRGAFWSVTRHPRNVDPEDSAKAAMEAIEQEYDHLDVEARQETIEDYAVVGFDIHFFYLDLLNRVTIRSLQTHQATYTIFCQAEDHDFAELQLVLQAMTVSLLQNLPKTAF
jgi:hypothetical protein